MKRQDILDRTMWFAYHFGHSRMKDMQMLIHADRSGFNEFISDTGNGHLVVMEFDEIFIHAPYEDVVNNQKRTFPIRVLCMEKANSVYMMPLRGDWTVVEKERWLALNN